MNDFHVKSVEMADSTKHEEGNAVILFSGKHEGYKMKVNLKKGIKGREWSIERITQCLWNPDLWMI